ncbi:ABC transporter substrate-binding protein [Modestobacter sp. NPDC049651]|uniref:ABC transporter substrate-binding protein n=1 Tax=unclassified Modestobacter TaxID=2643866 RepID=UPI0033FF3ABD
MSVRTRRAPLVAVLTAVSALALSACSSSNEIEEKAAIEAGGQPLTVDTGPEQQRIHTDADPDAEALVPDAVKADGVLTVATTPFSAPLDFYADDNATPIGNETDIAQLVADALGLELQLVPTAWENWPLATRSGQVEVTVSNVTVTEARKELFDFSSYRVDDLGFLAQAGSKLHITKPEDVAGLTVAVASGTNQEKILLAWDQANQAKGLEPVDVQYFQNDGDTTLALQSGRIDVSFGPNATAAYKAATSPDDFEVVGTVNGGWPRTAQIAVATAKGNGLAPAVTAALNAAIADGSYAEVLDRWGLSSEAVEKSETNPAGLPAS